MLNHADMPAPRVEVLPTAPRTAFSVHAGQSPDCQSTYGQQLLTRASKLPGIRFGGQGAIVTGGIQLHVDAALCSAMPRGFIRKRIFAVVRSDGSVLVRLPEPVTEDLVENGLAIRRGKNLLTITPTSNYQLELVWLVLIHAYWLVTSAEESDNHTILSEHILLHLRESQRDNTGNNNGGTPL